jgi:hypothetical protein
LNTELLSSIMSNDVVYGFTIPFPLEKMTNIPGILSTSKSRTPLTDLAESSHQNNSPTTRANDGPCPAHPSTATQGKPTSFPASMEGLFVG